MLVSESDSLECVAKSFLHRETSCALLDQPPLRHVIEYDLAAAWAQGRLANDNACSMAIEI